MTVELSRDHRQSLSRDEQRALFRKGLEDELATATRHVTAPATSLRPHPQSAKVLAAAYEVIRRVASDAAMIGPEQVETVIGVDWTDADRSLLWTTLRLYVSPKMLSGGAAANALRDMGAPVNDSTVAEARSSILRGWIEAQQRVGLLNHPLLVATGDPAHYLFDDDLVRQARTAMQAAPSAEQTVPLSPPPAHDFPAGLGIDPGFFARPCSIRFSEQIEELHDRMFSKNKWQPDNGKTRLALETFAWITGDKGMTAYGPADIDYYAAKLENIPTGFEWGRLGVSGGMAKPFDPENFRKRPPKGLRRSGRTINSYLSKLQAASEILKKTHWLPRGGVGNIMIFSDSMTKVVNDPANPKRVPWTPEHLRAMYSLPLWHGGGGTNARLKQAPLPIVFQDAAYWVPLIGTYLGLAREEACGLENVDFNFDCAVPYLLVQANMTRSKDGETKGGLKRPSRYRAMPIHPELLRLGLQRYVEAIEAEGHAMIFPELYLSEAKNGKEDATVPAKGGRRFYATTWCYIMDATHGLKPLPETVDGKKADFHSQRTYNNSVLASPEVSETLIADHMGHARSGTGARNYNRRALTLGQEKELRERLEVMVRLMPVVTEDVPCLPELHLLALSNRSRVGSATGRNAKARFCA